MSHRKELLLITLIILCLGLVMQIDYLFAFPSNTHAWAQSDRLAIAQGFINNGFNFFKPETYVMNHQFPYQWYAASNSSITAVDFPIHEYFVALIMKITGNRSAFIFRLYTLIYSFIGLIFLFKLSKRITDNFFKSILVIIFAATSPVFVYYQGGFLPTIPSLSNAIIGVFFFAEYMERRKDSDFNWSIFFITVAALNRTTFAIPLVAIFCYIFLLTLKKEAGLKKKILPLLLSITAIVGYYLYNSYLRETYGSMFLNYLIPPRSFEDFIEVLNITISLWGKQYFSILHYISIVAFMVLGILLLTIKKTKIKDHRLSLFIYSSIYLSGATAFAFLMFRQFSFHDYYFLDSFFLPLILLFALSISIIPFPKKLSVVGYILTIALAIPMILNAYDSQKSRKTTQWNRTDSTIENFHGTDQLLDSLGISRDAKIMVFTPHVPNIPFLLMDRKGYAIFEMKTELFKKALLWDYDYIVLQNDLLLTNVYPEYPEILDRLTKVFDNGKISICTLNHPSSYQTLEEFLGFENESPFFESKMTFEEGNVGYWQNAESTSSLAYTGAKSGLLTEQMEFGLTFKTSGLKEIPNRSTYLSIHSKMRSGKEIKECMLIAAIREGEEVTFFQRFPLSKYLDSPNQWEDVALYCKLPQVKSKNYEFSVYLWNVGREKLSIDDFQLKLYK